MATPKDYDNRIALLNRQNEQLTKRVDTLMTQLAQLTNEIIAPECKHKPCAFLHTIRCFKCITNRDQPNDVQCHLINSYNLCGGSTKNLNQCTKCERYNVFNANPPYKKLYSSCDKNYIEPNYGNNLCCECIINLANNPNLFINV